MWHYHLMAWRIVTFNTLGILRHVLWPHGQKWTRGHTIKKSGWLKKRPIYLLSKKSCFLAKAFVISLCRSKSQSWNTLILKMWKEWKRSWVNCINIWKVNIHSSIELYYLVVILLKREFIIQRKNFFFWGVVLYRSTAMGKFFQFDWLVLLQ